MYKKKQSQNGFFTGRYVGLVKARKQPHSASSTHSSSSNTKPSSHTQPSPLVKSNGYTPAGFSQDAWFKFVRTLYVEFSGQSNSEITREAIK